MWDVVKFTVSQEHFAFWCFYTIFIGIIVGNMLLCLWDGINKSYFLLDIGA